MNSLRSKSTFMRSYASRDSGRELSNAVDSSIQICKSVGFDLLIVETSGIGQGDDAITEIADVSLDSNVPFLPPAAHAIFAFSQL